MTDTKHTPGPWFVVFSDNATPHIMTKKSEGHESVTDLDALICAMPAEITQSFNSRANAHLIAAAPDLLEILKKCLRDELARRRNLKTKSVAGGYADVRIEQIRAAIARAEASQ